MNIKPTSDILKDEASFWRQLRAGRNTLAFFDSNTWLKGYKTYSI